jgi:hypothetical protein
LRQLDLTLLVFRPDSMYKMSLGNPDELPEISHYDVEVVAKDKPDKAVPFVLVRLIWNSIRNDNPALASFLKAVSTSSIAELSTSRMLTLNLIAINFAGCV